MKRLALVALLLLLPVGAMAQLNLPVDLPVDIPVPIPGLEKLFHEAPALTTSLADAVTEVPFLDDFNPQRLKAMRFLPRGPNNGFLLVEPGVFTMAAQSYCLHAGRYGPGSGDGYLYAPIKGELGDVVQSILRNSVDHPQIEQHTIQTLLWSVLARTHTRYMAPEVRQAARLLLTRRQIRRVNGGALGLIPDEVRAQILGELPPLVRQALEAEATLREMLMRATPSFEELEAVAVLAGEPGEPGEGSREVPSGRWSLVPEGYFVRYFSDSYSRTRVQISVPGEFTIEQDELGRITALSIEPDTRIETEYDDTVPVLQFAGDQDVQGYRFNTIRFLKPDWPNPGHMLEAEWKDTGWCLAGVPSGQGRSAETEEFAGAQTRYQGARQHIAQLRELAGHLPEVERNRLLDSGMAKAVALFHYWAGLEEAIGDLVAEPEAGAHWTSDHIYLPMVAWQSVVTDGTEAEAQNPEGDDPEASGRNLGTKESALEYDPSKGGATPGKTSKQRLGQSPRPQKDPCEEVKDHIRNSMLALELYYKTQPNPGESGSDYDNRIPGEADFGVRMDNCGLEKKNPDGSWSPATLQDFINYYKDAGFSDAAAEAVGTAVYKHEMTHVRQCQEDPEGFREDRPEDRREREIEAYCEETASLLDWLYDNCGMDADWEALKHQWDEMCM